MDSDEDIKIDNEKVFECDYIKDEEFTLEEDCYFVTFACYMTDDVSPVVVNYATQQTFRVFLIQMGAITGFMWEFRKLDQFQPIVTYMTLVRIIFALLCQMQMWSKYQNAIRMFNYLKRQKRATTWRMINKRYFCILICFMHIIESMFVNIANILILSQEPSFLGMIKMYVGFKIIISFDALFLMSYPEEVKDNLQQLNESGRLKMTKDYNSCHKLFKNLCQGNNRDSIKMWFITCIELFVNLVNLCIELYANVFFNYFAPIISIFI